MGGLFSCVSRLVVSLLVVLMCCGTTGALAQSPGQADLLDLDVSLPQGYVGGRDSLISVVSQASGVVVAYSSRAVPPGQVRVRRGAHSLGSLLGLIFGRYNVRYVCHSEGSVRKVVVAADHLRLRHVSGFCRDALTGEVLIGAHVVDTLLLRATAANDYGFFSLATATGLATIRASFVGYVPVTRTINLSSDTSIVFNLTPRLMLQAIEVSADRDEAHEADAMGVTTFDTDEVSKMPGLMGSVDLGRALQQTPGVKSGSEGFGGMSVRGGSQDQNNILLDDAPLFNANHALGFFSAFNSDAISSASLIKSGFPARYGGRISSVLDIKTKDGNMDHFEGNANMGLMASSLLLQGPIKKDKASFLFSARRTYFDLFSNIIQFGSDNHYSYLFYDFHAKANWQISASDRLRLSYFQSLDRLTDDSGVSDTEIKYGDDQTRYLSSGDENDIHWGTHLVSLRWNHIFGSKVFSNLTAWYSRYQFSNSQREESLVGRGDVVGNEYRNGIHDVGVRADVSIFPGYALVNAVRLGLWYDYKSYEPVVDISMAEASDSVSNVSNYVRSSAQIPRHEVHGYVEDHVKWGAFWAAAGIHFTMMSRDNDSPYLVGEPRLLAGYDLTKALSLKAGYSLTTQNAYQMRMLSVATPSDFWLPVPRRSGPQRAHQVSVEIKWKITPHLSLEVEAYNKKMSRIMTYKSTSTYELLSKMDWESLGASGHGYARGVEFFLHSRKGRLCGWLGYSLAKSRVTYPEINGGDKFRADNDCLHSIQLFSSFALKPNVDVSLSWTYGSGAPLTLPTQRYSLPGSNVVFSVEPKRNALTLPAEHQLNLGANIYFGKGRQGSCFSFGVYNVYARQNPMFVYWKAGNDAEGRPSYSLKKFSLIGFPCPYVKYSINF